MTNQLQLTCNIERAAGGCEFSNVTILPAEMTVLNGKSATIDGEVVRFKMWRGERLYVNQRGWTLGYFSLVDFNLTWGTPRVAKLLGDRPSPIVAQAVAELLGFEIGYRLLEIA